MKLHQFSVILFKVQTEIISSIKIQLSTNISNWSYYLNKSLNPLTSYGRSKN